jgi:hypothetical protein
MIMASFGTTLKTREYLEKEYDKFLETNGFDGLDARDLQITLEDRLKSLDGERDDISTCTRDLMTAQLVHIAEFIQEWSLMEDLEQLRWAFDNNANQDTFNALRDFIEKYRPGFTEMFVMVNSANFYEYAFEER